MNFKNWLLYEERIINEDFKTQREKFIQQGIQPPAVDYYLNTFKNIKDKKYKQINDPIKGLEHIKDRTNIDAYKTWKELEDFVDYIKAQTDVSGKTNYKNIKVDAEPIHTDNDLIIYYADTPQACVTYKGDVPYAWCIARSDASNMFYSYRFQKHEPSFYFVKNKERTNKELETFKGGKFIDKYHFFVIQVVRYADLENKYQKQYVVTSAQNDGDIEMSWDDILKLEPKLTNKQNIFISKPLGSKEKELHDRFVKGISDKEFENLPYDEKDMYLNIYVRQNRPLTDNQFKNLPSDLKNKYIGFGVGLSDEQFKMIDSNSKLYKRYEDVTKTKIEKTIGTDEFNLMPTEIIVIKKIASEIDFDKLSEFNLESLLGRESENQKEEMAELIIKYKSKISSKNASSLIRHSKTPSKIAELLKDNINNFSDEDISNFLFYKGDILCKVIIKYKKNLSNNDVAKLLDSARNKLKIAELLGTINISKLDGFNLYKLFPDQDQDDEDQVEFAIIIDRYHTNERLVKRFTSNFKHFLDKNPLNKKRN